MIDKYTGVQKSIKWTMIDKKHSIIREYKVSHHNPICRVLLHFHFCCGSSGINGPFFPSSTEGNDGFSALSPPEDATDVADDGIFR